MTIAKQGNKYVVKSEKTGKNLSKPESKAEAVKRLRQVEFYKNKGK